MRDQDRRLVKIDDLTCDPSGAYSPEAAHAYRAGFRHALHDVREILTTESAAIRALVQEWRNDARRYLSSESRTLRDCGGFVMGCADQLERLITGAE